MSSFLKILICCALLTFSLPALAKTELHVYGPGGPAPAMKMAAEAYMKIHPEIHINVNFGPAPKWMPAAQQNADLIFSGSEYMMNHFSQQLPELIQASIYPLYLRPSTLLVRPGNPKKVKGFQDLLQSDLKVLVVDGAGQVALWEDIAARQGEIQSVRNLRQNIRAFAPNSGIAKQWWQERPELDVWLIWNHWQVANPDLAEQVEVEPQYRIYRSCGIALTQKRRAQGFYDYLKSPEAAVHFTRFGWATSFEAAL